MKLLREEFGINESVQQEAQKFCKEFMTLGIQNAHPISNDGQTKYAGRYTTKVFNVSCLIKYTITIYKDFSEFQRFVDIKQIHTYFDKVTNTFNFDTVIIGSSFYPPLFNVSVTHELSHLFDTLQAKRKKLFSDKEEKLYRDCSYWRKYASFHESQILSLAFYVSFKTEYIAYRQELITKLKYIRPEYITQAIDESDLALYLDAINEALDIVAKGKYTYLIKRYLPISVHKYTQRLEFAKRRIICDIKRIKKKYK